MKKLQDSNSDSVIVSIGIQARSSSKRFANKVSETIGHRTVLQHVVQSVQKAEAYMNHYNSKNITVNASLLVPVGDIIADDFDNKIPVIDGSEDDVLSRYVEMQALRGSDYVVRITGDCPLIPPFLISKLITLGVTNHYDYVSNVDERCRTTPDGWDCEVISKRLLRWLFENAVRAEDREHVTTLIRREPPPWAIQGTVINFLDLSDKKISLDTEADLVSIRSEYKRIEEAYDMAVKLFGRSAVHRV